MRNLCCLLVTLLLGTTNAQGSDIQIRFSLTVVGTCEVQERTQETVTLHCTRDFRPADPRTLPALYGQLPPQTLTLVASSPAPSGGTLNEYRVSGMETSTFY